LLDEGILGKIIAEEIPLIKRAGEQHQEAVEFFRCVEVEIGREQDAEKRVKRVAECGVGKQEERHHWLGHRDGGQIGLDRVGDRGVGRPRRRHDQRDNGARGNRAAQAVAGHHENAVRRHGVNLLQVIGLVAGKKQVGRAGAVDESQEDIGGELRRFGIGPQQDRIRVGVGDADLPGQAVRRHLRLGDPLHVVVRRVRVGVHVGRDDLGKIRDIVGVGELDLVGRHDLVGLRVEGVPDGRVRDGDAPGFVRHGPGGMIDHVGGEPGVGVGGHDLPVRMPPNGRSDGMGVGVGPGIEERLHHGVGGRGLVPVEPVTNLG